MNRCAALVALLPFLAGVSFAEPPNYQVVYKGAYTTGNSSVQSLNNNGWIIGNYDYHDHGGAAGTLQNSPFNWSNRLHAYASINDAGVIAGLDWEGETTHRVRAAVLINGQAKVLADWGSSAQSINAAGNVAGSGGRAEGSLWLWNQSTDTYIGFGAAGAGRMKINSADAVAYELTGGISTWSASLGTTTWSDPSGLSKFTLAGISRDGWLAASSIRTDNSDWAGLLHKPSGEIINFNQLLGQRTLLVSMSDTGWVLGTTQSNNVFVWNQATGVQILNILTAPDDFKQLYPSAINDLGQVTGALLTTHPEPYWDWATALLSPIPAPGTSGMVLAVLVVGSRRRR